MSFVSTLADVVETLQDDPDLQGFAMTKWGKDVTVKRAFKRRIEIKLSELPIILVTRPRRVATEGLNRRKDYTHTVRLYAGFHQTDRVKANDDLIEFEELIDAALIADPSRGGTAIDTELTASENDEGENHPGYFTVLDFEIRKRN